MFPIFKSELAINNPSNPFSGVVGIKQVYTIITENVGGGRSRRIINFSECTQSNQRYEILEKCKKKKK